MPPINKPKVPESKSIKPRQIKSARQAFTELKSVLNVESWDLTSLNPIEFMFSKLAQTKFSPESCKKYSSIIEFIRM